MRGKVGVRENKCFEDRITPAYAGKRYIDLAKKRLEEDHPRLCGEKPV